MLLKLSRRAMLAGSAAAVAVTACARKPEEDLAGAIRAVPSYADGVAMAAGIASGETTALEQVEAAIRRANAVEPQVNGIVSETFEMARSDAAGLLSGAFAGVPSFIKDLIDWKGAPTMAGSRGLAGHLATHDNPFASKWRGAGIVSLGKSATPEAGLISSTEPLSNGATHNPWDLTRIPGGSSGGAAALVAARVVSFAHASDGGGSIRIPAGFTRLVGLKGTFGRMPLGPDEDDSRASDRLRKTTI